MFPVCLYIINLHRHFEPHLIKYDTWPIDDHISTGQGHMALNDCVMVRCVCTFYKNINESWNKIVYYWIPEAEVGAGVRQW